MRRIEMVRGERGHGTLAAILLVLFLLFVAGGFAISRLIFWGIVALAILWFASESGHHHGH